MVGTGDETWEASAKGGPVCARVSARAWCAADARTTPGRRRRSAPGARSPNARRCRPRCRRGRGSPGRAPRAPAEGARRAGRRAAWSRGGGGKPVAARGGGEARGLRGLHEADVLTGVLPDGGERPADRAGQRHGVGLVQVVQHAAGERLEQRGHEHPVHRAPYEVARHRQLVAEHKEVSAGRGRVGQDEGVARRDPHLDAAGRQVEAACTWPRMWNGSCSNSEPHSPAVREPPERETLAPDRHLAEPEAAGAWRPGPDWPCIHGTHR